MDARTFMGDVGFTLVGIMFLLILVVTYRVGRDYPLFVAQRRNRMGKLREYTSRFSATLDGVFGSAARLDAQVVWFFYQFGFFLVVANMLYLVWFQIGKLF